MDKRVLLIGNQKSFMVNAIAKGLEKEGYEVVPAGLLSLEIKNIENKPGIYILYLGDITLDDSEVLRYINEAIDTERFLLYMIGNQKSFHLVLPLLVRRRFRRLTSDLSMSRCLLRPWIPWWITALLMRISRRKSL